MTEFLIGTSNPGKFSEIYAILDELPYSFISAQDIDFSELEESGSTFQENALIKLDYCSKRSDAAVILCEDSGIVVEALADELGIHTRRWGVGKDASDEEWIQFFLHRMEGEENRRAEFLCCAALLFEGKRYFFEGHCPGIITKDVEAPLLPGLPLSSCFLPNGCDLVYAALSREEKAAVSHRGWAITQVRDFILSQL